MELWDQVHKLRYKNPEWESLLAVLVPILDVPELASTHRIQAAINSIKDMKRFEVSHNLAGIFSLVVSRQTVGSGMSLLSFASKSRRADIVSELVKSVPQFMINEARGSLPPLLTICQVPPYSNPFELQVSYASAKNTHKFKDWGYNWVLRISKPGENIGSCMCCRKGPVHMKKAADLMAEKMGATPFLSAHLDLREAGFLGLVKVKATIKVEVVGLSKPQEFVVSYGSGHIEGSPLYFTLADDSTKEYPLGTNHASKTVAVRFTVSEIKTHKSMWRGFRTKPQVMEEQGKIIQEFVARGADRDFVSTAGYLAFSYAMENDLGKASCKAVLPTHSPTALNALFNRKDLNLRELEAYMASFPPNENAANLAFSGLVRKTDPKFKNPEAFQTFQCNMLTWILKKGGASLSEITKALRASVDLRDWAILEILVAHLPSTGMRLEGVLLHDVVMSNKVHLLKKLLEAGANPNEPRTLGMAEGETPVHIAARLGNVEAVEMLLEHKGDCNVKEKKSGNTALHEAALTFAGNDAARVVQMMTQNGADTNAKNMRRQTPLQVRALVYVVFAYVVFLCISCGRQTQYAKVCISLCTSRVYESVCTHAHKDAHTHKHV
jgi:hypothetical protein